MGTWGKECWPLQYMLASFLSRMWAWVLLEYFWSCGWSLTQARFAYIQMPCSCSDKHLGPLNTLALALFGLTECVKIREWAWVHHALAHCWHMSIVPMHGGSIFMHILSQQVATFKKQHPWSQGGSVQMDTVSPCRCCADNLAIMQD